MRFAVNGTLVLGLVSVAPQLLRRNYVKLVQKLPLIELQLKSAAAVEFWPFIQFYPTCSC